MLQDFKLSRVTRIFAVAAMMLMMPSQLAFADVFFDDRLSEIEFDSTNLGGVDGLVDSTDLSLFDEMLSGSNTHIEPGGRINTGVWDIRQTTAISEELISTSMMTSTSITGDGSGILDAGNYFEVEFQTDTLTRFQLSGDLTGSFDPAGAEDFSRVLLQRWDGVTFATMYSSQILGSGDLGFNGFLDPFTDYRLQVESYARSNTNEAWISTANVNFSMQAVPEPAVSTGLGVLGLIAFVRRRR